MSSVLTGGTLFSGIGAPELAAPWVNWRWSAEIDRFASAVLAHHFPNVPNLGDVTKVDWDAVEPVDIVVFGSPCQSFSVAGKRAGLDDARGNLAIIGLQIVDRVRPDWVVFENVPGILSSDEWRDFGTFLGALGKCGYGFAYRVLDAQFAGVPQRRRRVFVVGYLGDWRPAAAVLFEPESLRGDSPPRRETGQEIARPLGSCLEGGGGYRADADTADNLISKALKSTDGGVDREDGHTLVIGPLAANGGTDRKHGYGMGQQDWESGYAIPIAYGGNRVSGPLDLASACRAHGGTGHIDFESETFVMRSLEAEGFDASEDGTGRGTPIIAIRTAQGSANGHGYAVDVMHTLDQSGSNQAICFDTTQITHPANHSDPKPGDPCHPLARGAHPPAVATISDPISAHESRTYTHEGNNFRLRNCTLHLGYAPHANAFETDAVTLLPAHGGLQIRRLIVEECEALQGFPRGFTLIQYNGKPAADGPRYRALGNAMAVPVVQWILERLRTVDEILPTQKTPVERRRKANAD